MRVRRVWMPADWACPCPCWGTRFELESVDPKETDMRKGSFRMRLLQ